MIKPSTINPEEVLKHYYGYENFRKGQKEIIDSLLKKKDTLAIMPTGSGKSICFQIPALLFEGKSIVISPLISLMKDQVDNLKAMDINATYINSSISPNTIRERTKSFVSGDCKILYIAPERLNAVSFFEGISSIEIEQVAVDEAHCVSQWGHDFRPSYKLIKDFVSKLSGDPILSAFTATATKAVRKDIKSLLGLKNPEIFDFGLKRSNIYIEVIKEKNKRNFLEELIKKRAGDSGIVYCSTRKAVDDLYQYLGKKVLKIGKYHAGMSTEHRKKMQDAFILEDIDLMIATNAFGMGIDKPNIRYIVHYNMPKSLESYYQEIGRAGRDGESSQAYLLYSEVDKRIQRFLIEKSELPSERLKIANAKLQEMIKFCHTNDCLWKTITNYFGEVEESDCENCRNCLDENLIETNITIETQKILSCVFRMNQSYGASTVAKVLKGSKNSKVLQKGFERLSTYGIMKELSEEKIRELISFLTAQGYLDVSHGVFPLLKLNKRSWQILKGRKEVIKKTSQIFIESHFNTQLFDKLKALRKEIAVQENVPPYIVFHDYSLQEMSIAKPDTNEKLLKIKGVGVKKAKKYGEQFLQLIKTHKIKKRILK